MRSAESTERVAEGLLLLADMDLDALCDEALDELVVDLQQLSHRLAAQVCRVTHRWERRSGVGG